MSKRGRESVKISAGAKISNRKADERRGKVFEGTEETVTQGETLKCAWEFIHIMAKTVSQNEVEKRGREVCNGLIKPLSKCEFEER